MSTAARLPRRRVLPFVAIALALGVCAAPATARTDRLTALSGAVAASRTDGTFAAAAGSGRVRYGNATTGRVATAVLPPGCYPGAATAGAALISCRAEPTTTALGVLDTRRGTVTRIPPDAIIPDATYDAIGRYWIAGNYSRGFPTTTLINRVTGAVIRSAPYTTYDLDRPMTPRPVRGERGLPGSQVIASYGPWRVARRAVRPELELQRGGRIVRRLRLCPTRTCHSAGISARMAAWSISSGVYRYDLRSRQTDLTRFPGATSSPRLVVQPRQVLVSVFTGATTGTLYRVR